MSDKYKFFSISGINALPRFSQNNSDDQNSEIIRPKSSKVSLYIHIPFCKTICRFCMLRRGAKSVNAIPDSFIDVLISESKLYQKTLNETKIDSIYFGGGTPSMLNYRQFEKILTELKKILNLNHDIEITFEGEPNSLNNYDLLKSLKENNVQRVSFGLQTFDEKIREFLGRTDKIAEIYELREKLQKLQFKEVNVDYLYNLPGTDIEFIKKDLTKLKKFSPDSIDFHPLKYISCSKFMLREIVNNQIVVPSSKLRIQMFKTIRSWCFDNNYNEQFADQYSRFGLDNSNKYMKHLYGLEGGEYIGLGPGARSHYGDYGFSNIQNLHDYISQTKSGLKPIDRITHAPLNDNYITCFPKRNDKLFQADINKTSNPPYFNQKINYLILLDYVVKKEGAFSLTKEGLNWYQNIQEDLLSENQKTNHIESILKRKTKLEEFNGYFDTLGGVL